MPRAAAYRMRGPFPSGRFPAAGRMGTRHGTRSAHAEHRATSPLPANVTATANLPPGACPPIVAPTARPGPPEWAAIPGTGRRGPSEHVTD